MEAIKDFNQILQSFKIKATCVNHQGLDNYFYYDLKLHPNARIRDLQKYGDEISLALKAPCKPGVKVMRDAGLVRMEFVAPRTSTLKLFDYFTKSGVPAGEINCLLGQTVDGQRIWMDLAQNPHLLIAGTTGSGKSVLLHNLVANILNYNDVHLYLVDPKTIEFNKYESVKRVSVRYSYDDTVDLLNSAIDTMELRYEAIRKGHSVASMKPVVIIIDEFADLIMQDKGDLFYTSLCRLAQKCRAAKMHIVLATQRPSVNIINGTIKANFPARIACRVASHFDSKVVLDSSGAEDLLGKGDALVRDNFRSNERFQIAYTDASEVCRVFGG
jgi:DNA segregation ATPase FtsK/SpoIIIE, S-DNA-T family